MEGIYLKEVYFGAYCKTCKYKDISEEDDPCYECLATPAIEFSHKPEKYEEKN